MRYLNPCFLLCRKRKASSLDTQSDTKKAEPCQVGQLLVQNFEFSPKVINFSPHLIYCRKKRGGGEDSDSDGDDRSRKPRRKGGAASKKKVEGDDGLSAKQRRKVVSKATISSSDGSDSEGGKLQIEDE